MLGSTCLTGSTSATHGHLGCVWFRARVLTLSVPRNQKPQTSKNSRKATTQQSKKKPCPDPGEKILRLRQQALENLGGEGARQHANAPRQVANRGFRDTMFKLRFGMSTGTFLHVDGPGMDGALSDTLTGPF